MQERCPSLVVGSHCVPEGALLVTAWNLRLKQGCHLSRCPTAEPLESMPPDTQAADDPRCRHDVATAQVPTAVRDGAHRGRPKLGMTVATGGISHALERAAPLSIRWTVRAAVSFEAESVLCDIYMAASCTATDWVTSSTETAAVATTIPIMH